MSETTTQRRVGAFGTLIGRIEKLEFKTYSKGKNVGKKWASLELRQGQTLIRLKSFNEEATSHLEQYAVNEFLAVWGAIDSTVSKDKVYTNFSILKVIPDHEAPEETSAIVRGVVMGVTPTKYATVVDLDLTENGYERFVRVELSKEVEDAFTQGEGEYVALRLAFTGKYGNLTVTEILDPEYQSRGGGEGREGLAKTAPPPSKFASRFNREVEEPAAAAAPAASAPASKGGKASEPDYNEY